ncbi:hypothetical protein HK104_002104 [Borealophlyctis nickersoniae]|nr:hypothetical protein HK104_002104 [Borealophlyctis nickersoniae]
MARPREVDVEFLDLTYTRLDDPEVEKTVEDKVVGITRMIEGSGTSNKVQLAVMFFERRAKKSWFTKTEEEVCWEQWLLTLTLTQSKTEREQIESRKSLRNELLSSLLSITQRTNEQKDHIPPLTSSDPFPYQIAVSNNADLSWTSMLKQIISTGGPSLMPT